METGCRCGRGPGGNYVRTYVRTYVRACVRTYVRGRKALGVHMLSRDPGHLGSPPVPAPPGQSKPALALFRGKGRRPSHVSRGVCLITTRPRLCLGGRLGWFRRCPLLSFSTFSVPSARRSFTLLPRRPLAPTAARQPCDGDRRLSSPPLPENGGFPAHPFRRRALPQTTHIRERQLSAHPLRGAHRSLPTPRFLLTRTFSTIYPPTHPFPHPPTLSQISSVGLLRPLRGGSPAGAPLIEKG